MKTYLDATDFLDRFINYERQMGSLVYNSRTFNIEGFRTFLKKFGNPQEKIPAIHIAGTKGKGSIAAMLEAALTNAGLRTGLYTSPHIKTYLERFRISGREIPEGKFVHYIDYVRRHLGQSISLLPKRYRTVFELLTAVAFLYFGDESVDIAILETGLGGRLDATNVVRPVVSIIASLGLDHTNLLGEHISDIAREKGGIIKKGIPVVLSRQNEEFLPEILSTITALCEKKKAPLIRAEEKVHILKREIIFRDSDEACISGQRIFVELSGGEKAEVTVTLAGEHQAENCRTALAALGVLGENGFAFNLRKAYNGLAKCHWHGRIEFLKSSPPIVLDGAHCPLSTAALRRTLAECFPSYARILLLGILKNKDAAAISRELAKDPLLTCVITFTPPTPRGLPAQDLARIIRSSFPAVEVATSPQNAVKRALSHAQPKTLIVATGSIYNLDALKEAFMDVNRSRNSLSL